MSVTGSVGRRCQWRERHRQPPGHRSNNGYLTTLSGNISLVFGSDVYSENTCSTELTNTTAGSAIKLGTTSGGNEVTKTVTYTASTNTITIDPSSDLTEDTTYYATLSNAWYYQNGACAQGASESISFTTDSVAPTVSSVAYRLTEAGTDGLTNASLTDTFYSVVTFSEPVASVESDTCVRPSRYLVQNKQHRH